ncbi:MAG TPA: lipopolysaccharide biosynthesis protein [Gemmatimonadaceae bacterium]|nr:lipopolysaccharide biosynthesis protein [Gemmatimonadaceae bacterium]
MSRTRRFLGGVGWGYFSQLVMTVSGFVLTPIILSTVGQQAYGLWAVGLQITAYLGLLDLGVVALLPREVAYAVGRANAAGPSSDAELAELIGRSVRVVLWQLPAVAAVAAAIWLFMPDEWAGLRGPMAFILLTFVTLFPLRLASAVLLGMQDLSFSSWWQTASWTLGTGLMVALVMLGFGLPALAAGWATTQLVASVGCVVRLRALHPASLPRRLPAMRGSDVMAYIKRTSFVSVAQVAQALTAGSDVLIVGKLLGPEAVVPYVMTGKLVALLANQPSLLLHVALPGLAELRSGSSTERLERASTALGQGMLMLTGLVLALVVLVNGAFVAWWVGAEHYAGLPLTVALCVLTLLRSWNSTVVVLDFALGEERRLAYTALVDGVVTVLAASALVWRLGAIGAPIGGIIGVAVVSLPANLRAGARHLQMRAWDLVSPMVPLFVRAAALAAAAAYLAPRWPPATFLGLAAASTAAALVYAATVGPLALRAPLGTYVVPRLDRLRRRG